MGNISNTPLMQKYQEMKIKHPDSVLLFRVGDFYELYSEDAITASEILGITMTRRAGGNNTKSIELAGFPYHSLDSYLPKLVRAGRRVAICEDTETLGVSDTSEKVEVHEEFEEIFNKNELKKWMLNVACPKMKAYFGDLLDDFNDIDGMNLGDTAYWFSRDNGTAFRINDPVEFKRDCEFWKDQIHAKFIIKRESHSRYSVKQIHSL